MDRIHATSAVIGVPVDELKKTDKQLQGVGYVVDFLNKWSKDLLKVEPKLRAGVIATFIHSLNKNFPKEVHLALLGFVIGGEHVDEQMKLVKKMEEEDGR